MMRTAPPFPHGLLRGEDVLFSEGEKERWIRLVHADHDSFINIKDPIPIYLAANGPRALQVVGEIADGWVTTLRARSNLDGDFAKIGDAAERFDSKLDHVLAGDDLVAVLFTVKGRRRGKQLDTGFILIFRVEEGRIFEVWAVPRDQHAVDEFWA